MALNDQERYYIEKMQLKTVVSISTKDIDNTKYQPRSAINEEKFNALKESIEQTKGNIEPILVTQENGKFVTIAGHRRVQACQELNIRVNAVVYPNALSAIDAWIHAIVTNISREEMAKSDIIESVKKLSVAGFRQREIAKKLSLSLGVVNKYFNLFTCEQSILEKIDTKEISLIQAGMLADFDKQEQIFLMDQIIQNHWNNDDTGEMISNYNKLSSENKQRLKNDKIDWFDVIEICNDENFDEISELEKIADKTDVTGEPEKEVPKAVGKVFGPICVGCDKEMEDTDPTVQCDDCNIELHDDDNCIQIHSENHYRPQEYEDQQQDHVEKEIEKNEFVALESTDIDAIHHIDYSYMDKLRQQLSTDLNKQIVEIVTKFEDMISFSKSKFEFYKNKYKLKTSNDRIHLQEFNLHKLDHAIKFEEDEAVNYHQDYRMQHKGVRNDRHEPLYFVLIILYIPNPNKSRIRIVPRVSYSHVIENPTAPIEEGDES
jgi:ParB/RepB/Spo0J family partition protein